MRRSKASGVAVLFAIYYFCHRSKIFRLGVCEFVQRLPVIRVRFPTFYQKVAYYKQKLPINQCGHKSRTKFTQNTNKRWRIESQRGFSLMVYEKRLPPAVNSHRSRDRFSGFSSFVLDLEIVKNHLGNQLSFITKKI